MSAKLYWRSGAPSASASSKLLYRVLCFAPKIDTDEFLRIEGFTDI